MASCRIHSTIRFQLALFRPTNLVACGSSIGRAHQESGHAARSRLGPSEQARILPTRCARHPPLASLRSLMQDGPTRVSGASLGLRGMTELDGIPPGVAGHADSRPADP